MRKILLDRSGLLADCLDRRRLSELLDDQASGRVDATDRLWRLLNLQIWGRIFLDGRRDLTWSELGR